MDPYKEIHEVDENKGQLPKDIQMLKDRYKKLVKEEPSMDLATVNQESPYRDSIVESQVSSKKVISVENLNESCQSDGL